MPDVTDTEMFFVISHPRSNVTVMLLLAFAVPPESSCPVVAMVALMLYRRSDYGATATDPR